MSEKTSMLELLNERMEKEDIVKLVCNYDNKFNELEKENKELKQKVKYYENFEINKTIDKIRLENNKREKELQNQLQQKDKELWTLEHIIKEVREKVNKYPEFNYSNDYMIFRNEIKEILRGEY